MNATGSEWKTVRKKRKSVRILKPKVLVLPFIKTKTGLKYLIVKDRISGDYTFISGSSKKNESITVTALRELKEETKNAIYINLYSFPIKKFTMQTSKEEYHVYFIDITKYKTPQQMIQEFKTCKITSKSYMENSEMLFCSLDTFKGKRMWPFIRNDVITHPTFLKIHKELSG